VLEALNHAMNLTWAGDNKQLSLTQRAFNSNNRGNLTESLIFSTRSLSFSSLLAALFKPAARFGEGSLVRIQHGSPPRRRRLARPRTPAFHADNTWFKSRQGRQISSLVQSDKSFENARMIFRPIQGLSDFDMRDQ
jgi:hypothetical protein